ncbi:hypothetical protein L917_20901, partial [Phytophthora nicotianae]
MGVPEGRGRSYGGRFKRERGESVLVVSDVYGFKNCSHRDQWNDVGRIRVSHPRTWRRKPNGGLEHKISRSSVGAIRWTVMRRAFAIDRFETVADESVTKPEFRQMTVEAKYNYASHLFANEIKTDGYNASILYYQPKQDELERGEDDPLVPAGYLPDVIIGLDSGMRSVCTAAHQYLRPQAPRRRKQRRVRRPRRQKKKKRKRNFPKWIRRPKALRLGQ